MLAVLSRRFLRIFALAEWRSPVSSDGRFDKSVRLKPDWANRQHVT